MKSQKYDKIKKQDTS